MAGSRIRKERGATCRLSWPATYRAGVRWVTYASEANGIDRRPGPFVL
jgi:hypothetical protein